VNKLIGKYVMWWEIYPDGASLNERGTVIADLGSGFLLAAIDDNEHGMRKVISLAANNGNSGLVIFDDKTAAQAWLASLEDDDDKRIAHRLN
jgi:hypothetical protein